MSKLSDILTLISDAGDIQLIFIRRTRKSYAAFQPNIDYELKEYLFEQLKKYLVEKDSHNYQEMVYNPCKNISETITFCSKEYVGNYSELIDSIDNAQEDTNPDTEEFLSFYCLKYTLINGDKVYFFRNLVKFRNLQKRGFLGIKIGNCYKKIGQPVLGVDGAVDLICTPREIVILKHDSLEKIFRITEEFERKANEVLEIISQANFIGNFDDFKNACSNVRVYKMLAKISEEQTILSNVLNNKERVGELLRRRQLTVEFDEGLLVYSDKEQLMDLINVLRDAYFTTDITSREGIDE